MLNFPIVGKHGLLVNICTPDIDSLTTQTCLRSLKRTTENIPFTLILQENKYEQGFRHASAINAAIAMAIKENKSLIIADDDVRFMEAWLHNTLEYLKIPQYANSVVLGYSLIYPNKSPQSNSLWFNEEGIIQRSLKPITQPIFVVGQCSACWFIPDPCKMVEMNTDYIKYVFELEACLDLISRGERIAVLPIPIIHEATKQARKIMKNRGLNLAMGLDHKRFKERWINNSRLKDLYTTIGWDAVTGTWRKNHG